MTSGLVHEVLAECYKSVLSVLCGKLPKCTVGVKGLRAITTNRGIPKNDKNFNRQTRTW